MTGRPPNPPELPTQGPGTIRDQSIHDIVAADALSCGYRTLAALVAERGRLWQDEHGGPLKVLADDDPMVAAVVHLADAMVSLADALTRLQQARREGVPRAKLHYEAILLVAGHMAKEVPLGSYRRAPGQGRVA